MVSLVIGRTSAIVVKNSNTHTILVRILKPVVILTIKMVIA